MQQQITIVAGDTLWSLAQKHLGNGCRWLELYHINRETILAEQKRRGIQPEKPEDWIFPGVPLTLPAHHYTKSR